MIKIYTDGAYSQSRDRGGYAFVLYRDGVKSAYYSKSIDNATNQVAEVMAVISAFRYIIKNDLGEVEIITDSMYVVGTATKGWKINANKELWREFFYWYEQCSHLVTFTHVRGHVGIEGNEVADIISVIASESIKYE